MRLAVTTGFLAASAARRIGSTSCRLRPPDDVDVGIADQLSGLSVQGMPSTRAARLVRSRTAIFDTRKRTP